MAKAVLKQINPVLPVRNVTEALRYYIHNLGFKLAFKDAGENPGYAGVIRDDVEIHLQWHDENDWTEGMDSLLLRIYVEDVELLFEEYKSTSVFHENTALKKTAWATKEFAFYDSNMNGLIFYNNL